MVEQRLDPFLSEIGWFKGGWYPMGPYFCMWLLLICHAMHVMTGPFAAWEPEGIECRQGSPTANNSDICLATFSNGTNSTNCESWSYGNVTQKDLTLVKDFDLVCEKKTMSLLINTLYIAGVIFGNIFFGSLPDRFGRKNVCLLGNFMLGVTAFFFAFANDIYIILFLRFIGGIFYCMTQYTVWMWVTELFSTKDRYIPVGMVHHGWSSGMVIISGVAYLVRSWRHLHLVVMGICFTALPMYLVLPESLYWLERNKKKKQSAAIMSSIRDRDCFVGLHGNNDVFCLNNKKRDTNYDDDDSDDDAKTRFNTENGECENVELAKNNNCQEAEVPERSTRTYWICLVLCSSFWFIDGLVYYGLQFSTGEFAGDRYLNFFLFSVVEYPATMLAFFLGKFTTRRFTLLFLHTMCGTAMVLCAILRWTEALAEYSEETKAVVFNSLGICAKFFVTACFSVLVYVPAELFPTNVRNTSFNINAFFSRVAAVMGTFMPLMFRSDPAVAECIFGLMGIIAGMTTIFLPESKNRPLPQTMEDLEFMAQKTGSIWKVN